MTNPKTQNTRKSEVYFNRSQIRFVTARQKTRVCVAGRGWGKSTVIAWMTFEMLRELPRGKVFFASTTIEQIKNSMLPPIRAKWAEFGLVEGIHYVIGKRPPAAYAQPIAPPEEYENVISFFNGFTIVMLSTAKPASKRGGSYDAGIIDEAAFVKRAAFSNVLRPMIRGNLYKFDSHWHHACILMTSQPRTADGFWIYEFEDKSKIAPDKVLFMEASAKDNMDVLGADWFRQQQQDLGHIEYLIEVENERVRQIPDGFYHKFKQEQHTYTPTTDRVGNMTDVRPAELLELSFDFGGKFNCCTVWQEQDNVERCLRQFWVKDEGKITEVVRKVTDHFRNHEFKFVRVWGEPRGHDRNPVTADIYTIIQQQLESSGWSVEVRVQSGYATKKHKERYQFAEEIMSGNTYLPRLLINRVACPDLIISIQTCDILEDYRKNKTKEKDEKYPQEHAPHLSDTLDYYLLEKHGWRLVEASGGSGGSVW